MLGTQPLAIWVARDKGLPPPQSETLWVKSSVEQSASPSPGGITGCYPEPLQTLALGEILRAKPKAEGALGAQRPLSGSRLQFPKHLVASLPRKSHTRLEGMKLPSEEDSVGCTGKKRGNKGLLGPEGPGDDK